MCPRCSNINERGKPTGICFEDSLRAGAVSLRLWHAVDVLQMVLYWCCTLWDTGLPIATASFLGMRWSGLTIAGVYPRMLAMLVSGVFGQVR